MANFFKRFIEENNSGSLYVLRQALKLVDDRSRVIIHRALWRAGKRNPYRNLYIVAATYDPGPRVQKFARQILRRRPMSEAEFIQHQRVVLGIDKAKD